MTENTPGSGGPQQTPAQPSGPVVPEVSTTEATPTPATHEPVAQIPPQQTNPYAPTYQAPAGSTQQYTWPGQPHPQQAPSGQPGPSPIFPATYPPALTKPAGSSSRRTLAAVALTALLAGGLGGVIGATYGSPDSLGSSINVLNSPAAPVGNKTAPEGSVEAVAQKVSDSVVTIKVSTAQGGGEGSGIIVSDTGLILTNNHVVAEAAQGGKLTVQFRSGQTADANVVGTDPNSDIAVIKAKGVTGLKPAEFGSSADLQVGQQVVAIGAPLGLSNTVTTGIVSALNRPVRVGGESPTDQNTVLDAIQTDAAINPGNSGGALVDMAGRVIGINSAIATAPNAKQGGQGGSIGLGFAIPIDQAQRIAKELQNGGKAQQSIIGVTVDSRLPQAQVGEVTSGGPADKAGIKSGDVITKINDRNIDGGDSLIAAVRSYAPGTVVKVTIGSGNSAKTVDVTLAAAPK
ncbi:PDZ domain-containing protein [Pseudonocardiaceae bacterium YIM PH 21723]|nr:PDZ domain-containing protein [Pseudonocardiaceae bacterium YIM PH 21723]